MAVKTVTLVKIAAIGGIITVSMGFALRFKINENIRQLDHYKEAMKILRSNPASVYLLGEPIKDKLLDLDNEKKNYTNKLDSHYEIPVSGSKQRGILHMWAKRNSEDEKYVVNKMELELKNEPDRRLLIKLEET